MKRRSVEEFQEHFAALIDLPSADRDGYLARIAAEDQEQAAELASLIDAHDSDASPLDRPALNLSDINDDGVPVTEATKPGLRVGPYVLISKIADGGMGTVWRAERADGLLKRKVALKLPHISWLTSDFAARMARERDILARLEHPNIARLYDAGVDELGRPYLAMEFIDGVSIDEYVKSRGLVIRDIVALIVQVARTVAQAHSQLIVHRDLKPSNILVTGDGQVHLLDFGVAKLLADEVNATQLTQFAGRAFTPAYASPEQITSEPITTATDIYSLAVLSYELLTGSKPYRLDHEDSAVDLVRAIATADVLTASDRAPDKLRKRTLKGDLDAILNKALKHLPTERYATIDAFAQDLERYLSGEPVLARPDAWTYRLGRFAARHRVAFASLSIVALSLIAATTISLYQLREARAQRERAMQLGQRHAAVADFLGTVLTEAVAPDTPITVADLLARSEQLASSGAISTVPEDRADILGVIGTYYSSLGDATKSVEVISRGLDSLQQSSDRELQSRLLCLRAPSLARLGKVDAAIQQISEAIRAPGLSHDIFAECMRYRAFVAQQTNDPDGAMQYAQQAIDHLERSSAPNAIFRAGLDADLAYAHQLKGEAAQAEQFFASSIAKFRAAGRPRHPTLITILNNRGIAQISAGDMRGAYDTLNEAMSIAATTMREPPAFVSLNYARVLEELAQHDRASELYTKEAVKAAASGNTLQAAFGDLSNARIALERGDVQGARAILIKVEPLIGSSIPAGSPPALAHTLLTGILAQRQGDLARALQHASEVVKFWDDRKAAVGATANALRVRADVLLAMNRNDEALKDAERAVAISRSLQIGKASSNTGHSLALLARVHRARGDTKRFEEVSNEAIAQLTQALGDEHPATRRAREGRRE